MSDHPTPQRPLRKRQSKFPPRPASHRGFLSSSPTLSLLPLSRPRLGTGASCNRKLRDFAPPAPQSDAGFFFAVRTQKAPTLCGPG